MKKHSQNLIWIDLEMTGLDTIEDRIIEIATIVTDKELNIIEEGPVIAIKTPEKAIAEMDDWNTNQHNKSGLVDRIKKSSLTYFDAQELTIDFLEKYLNNPSPTGFESGGQRIWLKYIKPYIDEYFVDTYGTVGGDQFAIEEGTDSTGGIAKIFLTFSPFLNKVIVSEIFNTSSRK